MTIDDIINNTIGIEGGYSNHPNDKGGQTKWGITQHVARANGYQDAMQDLPKEIAVAIYRKLYFDKPKFNLIFDIAPKIAEELFDTGVNMGPATAVKFLQSALNLLNSNGKLYKDITIDGAIGNGTIDALKAFFTKVKNAERILLKTLNGLQFNRYLAIAESNPEQEDFFKGWVDNRISLE